MNAPPVQYVTTSDGYDIAYTVTGEGMPLLHMHPNGHVQNDWSGPATAPWLLALSKLARLVQFDCRGQGMSTRGLPAGISMADYERDIEAVVERLGLEEFVFMAGFWYSHIAVRYAARNPGRIKGLILLHSAVDRQRAVGRDLALANWDVFLETLVTADWGVDERRAAIESFRQSVTQADWLNKEAAIADSDISELLPGLSMPALVLHARDNNRQQVEDSARVAALLPNAQYTLIAGSNQLGDAADGARVIEAFLRERVGAKVVKAGLSGLLSKRELQVLRLLAAGRSNQQIADELVISLNTVNRHVSNIYAKTGAANRAEAASYATRRGLA